MMKRYDYVIEYNAHGQCDQLIMTEDENGILCYASDATKEIERLRGLVEAAYQEGLLDAMASPEATIPDLWDESEAKKKLEGAC